MHTSTAPGSTGSAAGGSNDRWARLDQRFPPDPSRDPVLRAIGSVAHVLLTNTSWQECMDEILAELGEAADASRAYLFRNVTGPDGRLLMDECFEWVAIGIRPTIDMPDNHDYPYLPEYEHYVSAFSAGDVVSFTADDATEAEKIDLKDEQILSVVLVPVFDGEGWWGFLGFDDCWRKRNWTGSEIAALKAAAATIGAAIGREGAMLARQEAETRYRTLVEQIPVVVYVAEPGPAGEWRYMSPQLQTMLGYSPEEWLSHPAPFTTFVHPDDLETLWDAETKATEENPMSVEYRIYSSDGKLHWIRDESRLVPGLPGEAPRFQGVMSDITAQKLAEEELASTKEAYRTLVEQIPAISYVQSGSPDARQFGMTTYISPQVEHLLGYAPETFVGDPQAWERVVHPDDLPWLLEENERAAVNEDHFEAEYRVVAKDGRTVWVHDEAHRLKGSFGQEAWHGVLHDITSQMEALEREHETAERLRQLDDMKNTFLQAVSHDFRTPLAAIMGLAGTLGSEDVALEDDERKEFAERISVNARKLETLVRDLLDLERLERGVFEPDLRITEVGARVATIVEAWEGQGRRVSVETEESTAWVDSGKLERIVENLLANAFKHTPEGSHVWVRVAPDADGVMIVVEDDGPGVPEESKPAIFDPFTRGEGEQVNPGVGIGLSLVKRFAELQGGRAWVEDRPGGGASFKVHLPRG